ncbi:TetR/AcrR family transcriptional regulator [Jatrophihabitans sp. DSM 45814]
MSTQKHRLNGSSDAPVSCAQAGATAAGSAVAEQGVDAASGRVGRPVDRTRDLAIMAATRELICEVGYDRLTIEAVAIRARAGKATLYRRWTSKAELVFDAMSERDLDIEALPDTGELRSDLIEGLSVMADKLGAIECGLMSGLLTAMQSDAELAELVHQQMILHKRVAWHTWVDRALERGQLVGQPDADLLQEIVTDMFFGRMLMFRQPIDRSYVTHVVDRVLIPLLEAGTSEPVGS